MSDPKKNEPPADEATRCAKLLPVVQPAESGAPVDNSKPVPPRYVFKVVRADPKNTLNFEDVADK